MEPILGVEVVEPGRVDAPFFVQRYEIRETLHSGQDAEVLVVRDLLHPERPSVLKKVPGRSPSASRARRLENEYRLLREIWHPGYVSAWDFGFDPTTDSTYLVMERAPGVTLESLLPLSSDMAVGITVDVCRALEVLHARSHLHLDIKPKNILHDVASGRTTLVDLDLTTWPEHAVGRGTPPYASPEVMGSGPRPDLRTDLFSLGVTLYELLTGTQPPKSRPAADLDPGDLVPEWMRDLVRRLTAENADDRPSSSRDVIRALRDSGVRYPPQSRATRRALLSFPPFVGRRQERDLVLAAIPPGRRPRKAQHPLVAIHGTVGTGKSRLLQQLTTEWRCSGARVVEVSPPPGSARTLAPVELILEHLSRLERRKEGLVGSSGESGTEERLGTLDRLAARLLFLCRGRRTILVLEDVHLYDRDSKEFLLHLMRRVGHEIWESGGGPPVEIVLSFRSEELWDGSLRSFLETESRDGLVRLVEIRALHDRLCEEMVRSMVTPEPVPEPVLKYIRERSGGVPLFVREILLAHPLNPHGSGTLLGSLARGPLSDQNVPLTLDGVIRRRILACPETDLPALETVSLFPTGVSAETLAAMGLGFDDPGTLERLADRGFLVRHRGRFHVPDGTSREVVTTRLSDAERHRRHDAAAASLERVGEPHHEVVWHRLMGSTPLNGADLALRVVPTLLKNGAEEEALGLLDLVARRAERSAFAQRWAWLLMARVHLGRGQLTDARRHLETRLRRARMVDVPASQTLAKLQQREGHIAGARETLSGLLAHQKELSPADRMELALDLARILHESGRASEAREVVESTLLVLRPFLSLEGMTEAAPSLDAVRAPRIRWPGSIAPEVAGLLGVWGDIARHDGDRVLALRCYLLVLKLRSRLGDLVGLGAALHGIGTIFLGEGNFPLAERYFRRARTLREGVGDLAGIADTANNLGVLMRKQGRTAEAIDHYRVSLRIRRQIGHAAGEAFSYINIANVYYERRELDAATRHYDRALEVARRLSDSRSQAQVLNNLGAVAHLRDSYQEAIGHYQEAENLDRLVGNIPGAMLRRLNLAEEYLRVDHVTKARRLVATVARVARWRKVTTLDGRLALLNGRLAAQRGLFLEAIRHLEESRDLAEATDDAESAVEAIVELASVENRRGRPDRSLAILPTEMANYSAEAKARVAVERARALMSLERFDLAAVIGEVSEGERFARRSRLPGLEYLTSRTLALLRARTGDLPQALGGQFAAFEALEGIVAGMKDEALLTTFLESYDIQGFLAEVERFNRELSPGPRLQAPKPAEGFLRRLKDSLFDAERRLGPHGGSSHRHEGVIRRILEVSRTLRSTAPLDDLLREVVDAVVEISRAERAFLITVDERGTNRIPFARNRSREPIPEPERQISSRIVKEVLATGTSMRLVNALAESNYAGLESVMNLDLRSIMCAPLLRGNAVVGMLYVDNRSRVGQFTEADLELLDIFAAQVATALENARLVREFTRDEKIRVMGNLAGGVAHDFNNLLAVILGRAQTLSGNLTDPEVARDLSTIIKAAQDGVVVVRRMQEFTRIRREGEFRSVNLREVIEDALEFTRTRWEGESLRTGHAVTITQDVPEVLHVLGDPAELREVFTNLVLNSIQAMPRGGRLLVSARVDDDKVFTLVEDTGVGMTEEVRESIFDPYFTTKGKEGSGLGMSIVYGIILRHHGVISVESAPGEGTRISIGLPGAEVVTGPDQLLDLEAPVLEPGRRILVVEDEESVRELLKDILEREGFEVITAADGPTAVGLLEKTELDVVVTDLGMVPMTGWDVAKAAKDQDPTLAVVLVTGWGGEIDAATARRNQVDLLLNKPFDIEVAVAIVQEAVQLRDQRLSAGAGTR